MTQERRRTHRHRLAAYAALETTDRHPNDQAFSAIVDISRSGVGLRTGQPPFVGQHVILRLAIDDAIHTITTTASRVTPRKANLYDVGLDWSECSDEQLAFLDQYLTELAGSGS